MAGELPANYSLILCEILHVITFTHIKHALFILEFVFIHCMSVSTNVRKVSVLNNCTLIVSIPKDAIAKLGIAKGDHLHCSIEDSKLIYEKAPGVVA